MLQALLRVNLTFQPRIIIDGRFTPWSSPCTQRWQNTTVTTALKDICTSPIESNFRESYLLLNLVETCPAVPGVKNESVHRGLSISARTPPQKALVHVAPCPLLLSVLCKSLWPAVRVQ